MLSRPLLAGVLVGLASVVSVAVPVQAVANQTAQAVANQTAQASGQVVRVNVAAGKIAIRHGAIEKLDLPAMTLVYHIDPALLQGIAVGDKVQFTAERAGGQYRVIALKK